MPDDIFGPVMRAYSALAVSVLDPKPGAVIEVQPGLEVAWDTCSCDGQVWTRIITVRPTVSPTKASGQPCGVMWWNVTLGTGVLRCVTGLDDDGQPPPATQITSDGLRFSADLTNLITAITCAERTQTIVEVIPLGPLGGCAGSEVVYTIRVPICSCE